MKKKNKVVLLTDSDFSEIINVERSLVELDLNLSLLASSCFNESIEILCGNTTRLKPDIVIVNVDHDKSKAIDFLRIVRNYYSLRHIQFFVLADKEHLGPDELIGIDVSAILKKPLNFSSFSDEECLAGYNQLINALI